MQCGRQPSFRFTKVQLDYCGQPKPMSREEAIEFASKLEIAVNTHNTALIMSLYKEDAVMVSPMFPRVKGRAAIAENWKRTFSLFPDWEESSIAVVYVPERIVRSAKDQSTEQGRFGYVVGCGLVVPNPFEMNFNLIHAVVRRRADVL